MDSAEKFRELEEFRERREFADKLLLELCEKFPMGYIPYLEWKGLRVSAGMAYYPSKKIALSYRVLKDLESVRTTLIHEYAHLLAVHRHGRKGAGHGPAWRFAMHEMGLDARVRHNYEVERNERRQKVTYHCARCGGAFVRGRRLPRGRRYVHVGCGGELRLAEIGPVA